MENVVYTPKSKNKQSLPLFAASTNMQFLHHPKVLLVEDNLIARQAGQFILESLGCEVTVAKDAEEGLRLFHTHFQAVVLDIDLPGISGVSLARILRDHEPDLPLIACSSSGRYTEEVCYEAGINVFLAKPMRVEEIFSTLASLLRHKKH